MVVTLIAHDTHNIEMPQLTSGHKICVWTHAMTR